MPSHGSGFSCYVRSIVQRPNVQVVSIQINHKNHADLLIILQTGYLVAAFHYEGTFLLLLLRFNALLTLQVNEVNFFQLLLPVYVLKHQHCLALATTSNEELVLSSQSVALHFFHWCNQHHPVFDVKYSQTLVR